MGATPQHCYCQTLLSVSEVFNFLFACLRIASPVYSCELGRSNAFVFTEQWKCCLFMGIYYGIQGRIWDHLLHPSVSPRGSPQAVSLSQSSQVLGRKFLLHGGKSVVRLGDQNFKSYNFEDFFPYYYGSPNVGTHDKMLVKITHLLNLTFPWSDITSRLRSTWGSSICECELETLQNERRGVRNTFSETRLRRSSDIKSAY